MNKGDNEGIYKVLIDSNFGAYGINTTETRDGLFVINEENFIKKSTNYSYVVFNNYNEDKTLTKQVCGGSSSGEWSGIMTPSGQNHLIKKIKYWQTYQGRLSSGIFDFTLGDGIKFKYTGGRKEGIQIYDNLKIYGKPWAGYKITTKETGYSPCANYTITYSEKSGNSIGFNMKDGKIINEELENVSFSGESFYVFELNKYNIDFSSISEIGVYGLTESFSEKYINSNNKNFLLMNNDGRGLLLNSKIINEGTYRTITKTPTKRIYSQYISGTDRRQGHMRTLMVADGYVVEGDTESDNHTQGGYTYTQKEGSRNRSSAWGYKDVITPDSYSAYMKYYKIGNEYFDFNFNPLIVNDLIKLD